MRFRIGNKFGYGLCRNRRTGHEDVRQSCYVCHRRNVVEEIDPVITLGVDSVSRSEQKQRASIRGSFGNGFGGDFGGGARQVFNNERLRELLR